MKEILLTQGKKALVDDEDFEGLSKYKWCALKSGKKTKRYYAYRWRNINMHHVIISVPEGKEIDHIDGDGLNNQKSNLRIVTRRENMGNIHTPHKTRFPGVSPHQGKYQAQIMINGKKTYLGMFPDEEQAYNKIKEALHAG